MQPPSPRRVPATSKNGWPDLDDEGIWSELVFPSLGMWAGSFRTPELLREAMRRPTTGPNKR